MESRDYQRDFPPLLEKWIDRSGQKGIGAPGLRILKTIGQFSLGRGKPYLFLPSQSDLAAAARIPPEKISVELRELKKAGLISIGPPEALGAKGSCYWLVLDSTLWSLEDGFDAEALAKGQRHIEGLCAQKDFWPPDDLKKEIFQIQVEKTRAEIQSGLQPKTEAARAAYAALPDEAKRRKFREDFAAALANPDAFPEPGFNQVGLPNNAPRTSPPVPQSKTPKSPIGNNQLGCGNPGFQRGVPPEPAARSTNPVENNQVGCGKPASAKAPSGFSRTSKNSVSVSSKEDFKKHCYTDRPERFPYLTRDEFDLFLEVEGYALSLNPKRDWPDWMMFWVNRVQDMPEAVRKVLADSKEEARRNRVSNAGAHMKRLLGVFGYWPKKPEPAT